VPLPCLVKLPVPEIAEASVVLLLSPAVSAPMPSVIVPPVPYSAPTVWLWPLRSKVPPLTASAEPAASEPVAPRRSTPTSTTVPPL
jgi:hypothetical protein